MGLEAGRVVVVVVVVLVLLEVDIGIGEKPGPLSGNTAMIVDLVSRPT